MPPPDPYLRFAVVETLPLWQRSIYHLLSSYGFTVAARCEVLHWAELFGSVEACPTLDGDQGIRAEVEERIPWALEYYDAPAVHERFAATEAH